MKKNIFSMMLLAISIGFASCSDDADSTVERLSVAAFYPTIVMDGTEVSITGTGLSDVTTVIFPGGQIAKSVQVIDDMRIIAVAPADVDVEPGVLAVSNGTESAQSRQTISKAQPQLLYFNPSEKVKTYEDLQIEGNDFLFVKRLEIGSSAESVSINAIDFKRKSNSNITITVPADTPLGSNQTLSVEFENGEVMSLGSIDIEKGVAPGGKWVEQEIDLYSGGDVEMGGWSAAITGITADAFAEAKIGDRIRVYIKDQVESWQQGSFKHGSTWGGLTDELGVISLTADDFEKGYYEMTIDEVTLPLLQEAGLIISGCNYTATKVVFITTVWVSNTQEPQETILSDQETDMGGWSAAIIIGKESFETAKVGDIVRVYIMNPVEGRQQGSFKNGSDWGGLTEELGVIGLSTDDFEKGYYEMTINDITLPLLQNNGLIISGCNYTAVKVVLIQ